MGLIRNHDRIVRQIVVKRGRRLTGWAPGEIARVVLDDDRISAIQSASDVSSLETLVQGFDEYTLSAEGYGGDYPFNQPAVNGTYPWPRLDYTLLRSL